MKGRVWSTEGTKSNSAEVTKAHKPWVTLLCIASLVLVFGSLVSPLVQLFVIKCLEVMMNISSLTTRHNPCTPLPDGGTYFDASTRARILKGLEVRLVLDALSGEGDIQTGSKRGSWGREKVSQDEERKRWRDQSRPCQK
jgi:hypothetical protein